jgi:hypothetical protein
VTTLICATEQSHVLEEPVRLDLKRKNLNLKTFVMKTYSKILIALGAGLVAGTIIGVLFAPDKGSETRKKITDSGKKLSDKITSKIKEYNQKKEKAFGNVNSEMEEAL